MKKLVYYFALTLIVFAHRASAQVNSLQLSVIAEATIQEEPPSITLSWLPDDSATSYTIYRYDTNQQVLWWNSGVFVGKNLTWTDTNVAIGVPYQYEIVKQGEVPGT